MPSDACINFPSILSLRQQATAWMPTKLGQEFINYWTKVLQPREGYNYWAQMLKDWMKTVESLTQRIKLNLTILKIVDNHTRDI